MLRLKETIKTEEKEAKMKSRMKQENNKQDKSQRNNEN